MLAWCASALALGKVWPAHHCTRILGFGKVWLGNPCIHRTQELWIDQGKRQRNVWEEGLRREYQVRMTSEGLLLIRSSYLQISKGAEIKQFEGGLLEEFYGSD